MNHPIDNQYRYGIVYNLDGQIVGFNLSTDVCICLTDEEIEKVLGAYARKIYRWRVGKKNKKPCQKDKLIK